MSAESLQPVSDRSADRRIRSLRGSKLRVDPWRAHGSVVEDERRPGGRIEQTLTVFLAGAECPFTCSFCDLWRYTIDGATLVGALPSQITDVLSTIEGPKPQRIKLYNASNFFDRRAVPPGDVPRIAELCESFTGVTVESHASTIGKATLEFAGRLASAGARLEVAMGLETIHPEAGVHLNKRLDLARFASAAELLTANHIALRVFVLLGAPYIARDECAEWAVRTAAHAAKYGAELVSIIPVRGGNGEMERLADLGHFSPPTLVDLEAALDACIGWPDVAVTVDLWDVEKLAGCPACRDQRVARLHRMNLSGDREAQIDCAHCMEMHHHSRRENDGQM